jgi:hypothetical protein
MPAINIDYLLGAREVVCGKSSCAFLLRITGHRPLKGRRHFWTELPAGALGRSSEAVSPIAALFQATFC